MPYEVLDTPGYEVLEPESRGFDVIEPAEPLLKAYDALGANVSPDIGTEFNSFLATHPDLSTGVSMTPEAISARPPEGTLGQEALAVATMPAIEIPRVKPDSPEELAMATAFMQHPQLGPALRAGGIDETKLAPILGTVVNEAAGAVEFGESLAGVATAGIGKAAPLASAISKYAPSIIRKTMALAFGLPMVKAGSEKLGEGSVTGDPRTIASGATEMLFGGGLTLGAVAETTKALRETEKGTQNARNIPSTTSVPEHEVRTPMGETPPLRQSRETPSPPSQPEVETPPAPREEPSRAPDVTATLAPETTKALSEVAPEPKVPRLSAEEEAAAKAELEALNEGTPPEPIQETALSESTAARQHSTDLPEAQGYQYPVGKVVKFFWPEGGSTTGTILGQSKDGYRVKLKVEGQENPVWVSERQIPDQEGLPRFNAKQVEPVPSPPPSEPPRPEPPAAKPATAPAVTTSIPEPLQKLAYLASYEKGRFLHEARQRLSESERKEVMDWAVKNNIGEPTQPQSEEAFFTKLVKYAAEQAPAAVPKPKEPLTQKAVQKVQTQVEKVARTEGSRPAKEIKSELVSRLEKAIEDAQNDPPAVVKARQELEKAIARNRGVDFAQKDVAHAMEKSGVKKVTIDIPGDGVFTIYNTKEALTSVLERAKKISTSKGEPTKIRYSGTSKADKEWIQEQLANPPTPEIVGMGGAVAEEFKPPQGAVTGIKNAAVDAQRQQRGLPPILSEARRTVPQVYDEAMAKMDAQPDWQDRLVKELAKSPRTLTPVEEIAMLQRETDLRNEYAKSTREAAQAYADGRTEAMNEANLRTAEWSDKLTEHEEIMRKVGTAWGISGRFRQLMMREDYSLASMELQKRAANEGRPLNDAERAELTRLHDRIAELEAKYEQAVNRKAESASTPVVDNILSVEKARTKSGTRAPIDLAKTKASIGKAVKDGEMVQINGLVQKLVRAFVEENPKITRDELVDKVHAVLRDFIPEIERRETMDAISGYGDFKPLKKDTISVIVRDLKGQLQQIGKLEDMASGKAPQKTGLERRTPSDEERRLIKQVEEAKRRGGYKVTDPATQLRTRLQAAKTAIENQIKDLEFEIAKKERIVKVKTPMVPDKELLDLRAKRDALKAEHKSIFGERVLSEAQKIKMAEASLDRQIKDIQEQLQSGKIFPEKPQPSTLTSPGIESKLQTLAELKLRRYYERERIQPRIVPEIREANKLAAAIKSVKTRIENQIKDLELQIQTRQKIVKQRTPLQYDDAANALKARLDELKAQYDEIFPREPLTDAQRLANWKKRTAQRIQELNDRLAAGDFAKRPTRPPPEMDPEALNLQAQLYRAKQSFQRGLIEDRLKNRPWFEKAQDTFLRWYRGGILSSPVVFAKLTAAAIVRAGLTPVEEAVGVGIGKAFPKLAERAPREGYWNSLAEAKAITSQLTKGPKDAWDLLRTGETNLDVLYGKGREGAIGEQRVRPFSIADIPGRTHGAWKASTKRAEFERSLTKRLAYYIRNGVDASNPAVQLRASVEAYKDANRSIFLQDNRVVSAYQSALRTLEQKGGKPLATVARTLVPIVRVPSNIVSEAFQFALGSVTGSAKLARAFSKGIETLPPEQADLIMRELKKGSIGGAALMVGYLLPNVWGGFYQKNEKRNKADVKPSELRIGETELPQYLLHHPIFETIQAGATVRRVADRNRDPNAMPIAVGTEAAVLGLIEETPFINEMLDTAKAFDPRQKDAYFGELARSIAEPQLLQWLAKRSDRNAAGDVIPRKPTTFVQQLKMGVPGLRQQVPLRPPPK